MILGQATAGFSAAQLVALCTALLCLMLSGFVSASEIAFFSLTPGQLEEMEQDKRTNTIERLLGKPERLLATILIANNLVNVAIVVLCNFALGPVFEDMSEVGSFVLQTVILTFLILLFGEILPKIYSNNYPEKWARFAAPGVLVLTQLFRPVSKFLVGSTAIVNRVVTKQSQALTTDDLSQALEITSDADDSDKDILEGILRYGNTQASEIMTPRINITDINIRSNFAEVMQVVVETGYSRIPVYEDNEDNIRGILFSRDLLPYIGKVDDSFDWRKLLREPYFVPESRMIDDLLEDFRKRKQHLAIVVDEYGGTQGIVTLEDVLEEIVGDINDEYDSPEAKYKR
ncbi:MAG: gliding motility-associated protein GldE, partial [Muribaculaceae bacterium]